ncbi:MAG: putative glycosyltransferase [Actinomycetia bacterium]|nr:putative glycosyltransferase [Actinomycetes bacterium]
MLADTSAGDVELVVVDNGSTDDSIANLARDLPDVRVVHAPGNVGYARGANLGIAATRAPVVAVLNSDTEVEPGTAAALLGRFDSDPQLGAVGPRVRNPDGTDYPSARSIPSLVDAAGHSALGLFRPRNRFTRRYRQLDADPDTSRSVDWLSGAAMWLRRAALDDIGGWDERYFMYMEDLDLCWRLRRAGWAVVYEPAGAVLHVQGVSTARVPYRMLAEHHRSAYRFTKRRMTGWRRVLLPFAAGYLAGRAFLAMAMHAVRRRRP